LADVCVADFGLEHDAGLAATDRQRPLLALDLGEVFTEKGDSGEDFPSDGDGLFFLVNYQEIPVWMLGLENCDEIESYQACATGKKDPHG
jgi:hypothetical protein